MPLVDRVRRLVNRCNATQVWLVSASEFRDAAALERMRVQRNDSSLTVIVFQPTRHRKRALAVLENQLRERLSAIDTAGHTSDGRVGVLLPDYSLEDSQSLVKSVIECCETEGIRLQYDLIHYPDEPIDWLFGNTKRRTSKSTVGNSAGTVSP